jgi:hypothetical protein
MKALFLKDVLTMKRTIRTILIVIAGGLVMSFALQDASYATMFSGMVMIQLVLNGFAYDETCKWDMFAVAMPFSRKSIVRQKYLLTLAAAGGAFVVSMLMQLALLVLGRVKEELPISQVLSSAGIMSLVYLLACCIVLPVVYKVGIEKARFVMIGAMLIPFFAIFYTQSLLAGGKLPWVADLPTEMIALGGLVLLALVFVFSLQISTKIYSKKAF